MANDLSNFPRASLWDHQTPLELATNLTRAVGSAGIYIKREDCSGLAFGGNKVRQLEYYLGDAIDKGADTVLMTGAVQSNFVRTAAAACCKLGLKCHIQLEDRVPKNDPEYNASGNVLLDQLFGASLSTFSEGEDEAAADKELQSIAEKLRAEGKTPYIVPMHPSHPPIGALGYIHAARELVQQIEEMGLKPDRIFVGSGSGNTHSGLLYGLRAFGNNTPVTGVCVRREKQLQLPRIQRRCDQLAQMLGETSPVAEDDVIIDDSFLAPGYGRAGEAAREALVMAAQLEGLIVDPVYTSKVLAAVIKAARENPEETYIFIHTGGGPAIFGYAQDVRQILTDHST